jgi:hypothetical protein
LGIGVLRAVPSEGTAMKLMLKDRLIQIVAAPIMMLLSLILLFGLKHLEEEERQRELDL